MSANQQLLAHLCGLALVIVLKLLRTVPITFDRRPANSITSPISVPTMYQNGIFSIAVISFMDTAISYHRYLDYKYMYSKSLIP